MADITEEMFKQELNAAGINREVALKMIAAVLGIRPDQVGTIIDADTIIGGVWPTALRGSTRGRCASCKDYVALAPSSQRAIAARPIRVLCMRCARKECADA